MRVRVDLMDITEIYNFLTKKGEYINTQQYDELTEVECWKYSDHYHFIYFRQNGAEDKYIVRAELTD